MILSLHFIDADKTCYIYFHLDERDSKIRSKHTALATGNKLYNVRIQCKSVKGWAVEGNINLTVKTDKLVVIYIITKLW